MKKANKGKVGIIVGLAAALSCSSAIAISQLCVQGGNAVLPVMAETTADVSVRSMTCDQIAAAWNSAVEESIRTGKQVTFTLEDDWTAAADSDYTTSFGTGTGFDSGRILIPAKADIVLDLNGHVIDRGLKNKTAVEDGGAICVNGTLKITDSQEGGKITGGNTVGNGGGVLVAGGKLELAGGDISDNTTSTYGGGIYLNGSSMIMSGGTILNNTAGNGGGGIVIYGKFEMSGGTVSENTTLGVGGGVSLGSYATMQMYGGTISENTAGKGGGVNLYNCNTFTMYGGEITHNNATVTGGGVNINYYTGASTFKMYGGTISNNESTGGASSWMCKGIYVAAQTSFEMYDGVISNNNVGCHGTFTMDGGEISDGNGGGVILQTANAKFTMNGGEIKNNGGLAAGNAVAIYGSTFVMNGGAITGNRTTANTEYGGGAIYVNSGAFEMNGGIISNNSTSNNGGAVYVISTGKFAMNGGTISDNVANARGGGAAIAPGSVFELHGGVISGNVNADDEASNVYLSTGVTINVTGRLLSYTYVGISTTSAITVTSGYTSRGNKVGRESGYFISDNPDFEISNNGTEVTLIAATSTPVTKGTVDWSYKSYSATSTLLEEVDVEEGTVAVSATYTGGAFQFDAITQGIATAIDENGRTVTNFVNVGTYYLTVPYNDKPNYSNPFFTFEILPADFGEADVTVKADPVVYSGTALSTSVKVFLGGTMLEENKDYTVSYKNNVNVGEGTVVITAMGNYTGTFDGTFKIEKAKLGVRWGVTTLTYNGEEQGLAVYPEGLKAADDEVTLTVTYYDMDGNECTPLNVGKYKAVVTIDDDNYEFTMPYETYFFIEAKKVDVVWSNTEFTYNGEAHELTAHFIDTEGNEVELTVTAGDLTNAGKGTATAALPDSGYENYVLTDNTISVSYVITQAEIEAVWGDYDGIKYDGTEKGITVTLKGLKNEDLSSQVVYTYYNADGKAVTPVDAGVYTVQIAFTSANYKLVGKTEDSFTVAKADLNVTVDDVTEYAYDGTEKSPLQSVKDEYGTDLSYTVNYSKVDANGNVLEDLGETKPVNAGKYVLTVTVDAANVEQTTYTANFEITAMTVTVEWNFGDTAVEINGVYTYLYNGTAQQPTATAQGVELLTLTVTGTGKSVGNGYKAVASLNNSNYVLDGETEVTFNIIKSKVVSVLWYEYGATEPLEEGVIPRYEYISVFGQEDGARLSAYGVLTAADEDIQWTCDAQSLIKLNVTYDKYSEGFWTEIGTYSAYASLSSADKSGYSCYMPLGINDTLEFEVTNITHSASVAEILWVVVNEDGTHTLAKDYKFIYNGEEQTPVAIRILSNSYDPYDPDEDTFEFLTVGGAQTDAGTHYAYIIPEGNYEIKDEDSECKFVIAPLEVEIEWGDTEFTYNGKIQAPTATVVGDNELECEITVEGFIEAGSYTATAQVGNNFTVKGDATVSFTIAQYKLSANDIVWAGEGAEERTGSDGAIYFVWQYDGATHQPTATLKIKLDEDGDEIEISLAITGSASAGGTHFTYATLESSDPANANFQMDVARIRFDIVQNSITVVWEDEVDGKIVYTYDGNAHTPKAYYLDGEEKVYLNVVGSATEAGDYVAFITDDIDITNGATKVFTIKAQQLTAEWDKTELSYTGEERTPTVIFYSDETDEDGNPVAVTLKLGVDYTVTGYTNAGSYTSEITLINGNYALTDGATHAFTITKKSVTVIWYGVDGSEDDFAWNYDGKKHVPTFKSSVEDVQDLIVIKGAETQVGTYTAVAILDNDNYTVTNPTHEFSIKGNAISIIWVGNENAGDDADEFTWEYDGNEHAPQAYIALADGTKGAKLDTVGVGIYAGEYTVKAILPANCSWADGEEGERTFTVSKKVVYGIVWTGVDGSNEDFDWEYDGKYHAPQAQIKSTGEVLTVLGAAVNVSGKDVKYTATAVLANSENYEFADGVEFTVEFTIHAKTVNVTWKGANGSLTDFSWAYDGNVHAPTAVFTDVNGEEVSIPVIGGTASGGQHVAKLMDVYENYDFVEAKLEQPFSITEIKVSVEWTGGEADENGALTFTYEYNGKAHTPVATVKDGEEEIALTYIIKNGDEAVGAIIDAGTYTVTVTPSDKNYKITKGEVTVTVIVEPKKVEIKWGNTTLTENGSAQAPEAWFIDVNGQKIGLTVDGAGTAVDEYTATVISEFANYTLTGDKEVTFNIVKNTATEYVWVWVDGVGGWQAVTAEPPTDPDEGDGSGEVTDPTDPDTGDNGDGEVTEPPVTGGDGGEVTEPPVTGGEGEDGGTTPTNPETPNPDPADGENTTTDPNGSNKDDGEDEGDNTDPDTNA